VKAGTFQTEEAKKALLKIKKVRSKEAKNKGLNI
jgi:hypothetical protein